MTKQSVAALLCLVMGVSISSCGNRTAAPAVKESPTFQMVTVPMVLTDPQERADFLARHWWDHFDFSDSLSIAEPEVAEQAFAEYLSILPLATEAAMREGLQSTMRKAEADTAVYRWFREQTEKYLWDPNSPFRNEGFYIPVLESIIASEAATDPQVLRAKHLLSLAVTNRPGTPATDFEFQLADSTVHRLYEVKGKYTLLFFSNPGCPMC